MRQLALAELAAMVAMSGLAATLGQFWAIPICVVVLGGYAGIAWFMGSE